LNHGQLSSNVSGNLFTFPLVNLCLDELYPVDPLRLEAIVTIAEDLEMTFLMTSIDREGTRMLNLEFRSRATPCPVRTAILALVTRSRENPLYDLGGNITGIGFVFPTI
jgi:hypothetical protein